MPLVAPAGEFSSPLHTGIGTKVTTSVVAGTCVYLPVLMLLGLGWVSIGLAGN
jgi:hypothetical protein